MHCMLAASAPVQRREVSGLHEVEDKTTFKAVLKAFVFTVKGISLSERPARLFNSLCQWKSRVASDTQLILTSISKPG